MLHNLLLAASFGLALLATHGSATAPTDRKCENARYESKHKAFVLTDMSNEPDDQMSLVRLLTYSNEIDIRGIGVVTSKQRPCIAGVWLMKNFVNRCLEKFLHRR